MDVVIETDVLVIGAGPTGLTAANLLADQRMRVLLIERNAALSDEPRAISIADESLRVMQRVGILDRLAPEMLMDTGARYYGRRGQLLAEVRAARPRLGHPAKSQFDQPILAQLLLDAACERPSIDVRFNTEAFGITSYADRVEAVLVDDKGRIKVRAKWVVACDGGRSPVRSQLGIPLEGSTQVQKWIVVDVLNSPGEPERFSQFYCNGKRPAVVVPGVKGRARFEFMLLPGEEPPAITSPDSIIQLVAPYQRIGAGDIRRAAVYVSQQRIALNYRAGRVLLAGDAAHLMPPFAGQGLNAGIRDVANLAWKIAAHVQGLATEALIDSYQAERRPHAADMVRLSLRIGKVVMTTHPVLAALRDGLLAALSIVPAAKRWVVGMRFLKQPRFVAGCVAGPSQDVPPSAAEMIGRALAQPTVRSARGDVAPLDTLLGSGWALLRFTGDGSIQVQVLGSGGEKTAAPSTSVFDDSGTFGSLARSGVTLWVRPDRYVATASRTDKEAMAAEALAHFVPDLPARLAATQQRHEESFRPVMGLQA